MRRSAIAPSAARQHTRKRAPPPAFSCRAAAGTRPTSRAAADPRRRPKAPLAARAPVPPASPFEGCQLMSRIRRYLMTGLLVWLPLGVTIFVVMFLVNTMAQTLLLLPAGLRPNNLLGFHIPGLGVLLTVGVILLTGIVMAHFFGKEILAVWESILNRIPLVRSIYTSVKQLSETLLSTGEDVINVYVPTTPNPTSGFFLMIPRKDVVELDMSVDQGLKMIISMGVEVPKWQGSAIAAASAVEENLFLKKQR